ENHAFTSADNSDAAALVRIEPAHVEVRQLAAGKLQRCENNVGNLSLDDALPAALHGQGLCAQEAQGDRDVVRRQRPPGVFIRANRAQVEPLRVHIEQFSQVAAL